MNSPALSDSAYGGRYSLSFAQGAADNACAANVSRITAPFGDAQFGEVDGDQVAFVDGLDLVEDSVTGNFGLVQSGIHVGNGRSCSGWVLWW